MDEEFQVLKPILTKKLPDNFLDTKSEKKKTHKLLSQPKTYRKRQKS